MNHINNNQRYNILISAEMTPQNVTCLTKMKNSNLLANHYTFHNVLIDNFELRRPVLTAQRNQNRGTGVNSFYNTSTPSIMPANNGQVTQVRKVTKFERTEGFRTIFMWNLPNHMPKIDKERHLQQYFEQFGEIFRMNIHGANCGHIIFRYSESLDKMFQSVGTNFIGNPLPLTIDENSPRKPTDYSKYYTINLMLANREIKIHRSFRNSHRIKQNFGASKIIRICDVKWSMDHGGLTEEKIKSYFSTNCGQIKGYKRRQNGMNPNDHYFLIEFVDYDGADKAMLIGHKQNILDNNNGRLLVVKKEFGIDTLQRNEIIGLDRCASNSLADNRLKRSLEDSISLSDDEANCTITGGANDEDPLGETLGLAERDSISNNMQVDPEHGPTFKKRMKMNVSKAEQDTIVSIKEEINRTISQEEDGSTIETTVRQQTVTRERNRFPEFNENPNYQFCGNDGSAPNFS